MLLTTKELAEPELPLSTIRDSVELVSTVNKEAVISKADAFIAATIPAGVSLPSVTATEVPCHHYQ